MLELLTRLRREGRTLVVVSHDFDGLDQVCPSRIELVSGRVVSVPSDRPRSKFDDVGVTS
jgi:energy-coupling factor transport system ATP-binding protein